MEQAIIRLTEGLAAGYLIYTFAQWVGQTAGDYIAKKVLKDLYR